MGFPCALGGRELRKRPLFGTRARERLLKRRFLTPFSVIRWLLFILHKWHGATLFTTNVGFQPRKKKNVSHAGEGLFAYVRACDLEGVGVLGFAGQEGAFMKKRLWALLPALILVVSLFGCAANSNQSSKIDLADGVYTAEFKTDSGMFHVNEACKGKGELTVKDGAATIHVSLASKKIVNLYPGSAEDAKKSGAELLQPTTDSVTYEDGMTEEVYGFDIPVPAIGEPFDCALVGEKGKWYDHKVTVENPVAQ